jgi:hypothetical protein
MKKISILIISAIALSSTLLLNSCENTEAVTPTELSVTPAEAGSGELLTIKGSNLANLQQVLFGEIDAYINPVYNTDGALLIRVPKGTKFGPTTITLVNKGGDATKTSLNFKVLQPKPVVSAINPKSLSAGEILTITGTNFIGENFAPGITVKVGGVAAKILTIEATQITIQMPNTPGGKVEVSTANANGGGIAESLDAVTVEKIFSTLMDFDGGGAADKSWFYWAGDTDLTGGFYSNHTAPAPKSGKYGKLGATKGSTKNGYAMIGHDPAAAKWTLTDVKLSNSALRMDVNHNGFKKTVVAFEFETTDTKTAYKATVNINGPDGWYNLQIPLSSFKAANGKELDPSKLGQLKMFLQGYSADSPMEMNIDNIRLSQIQ